MGNVGERALTNIATPIARDKLPGLVSNLISRAINTFDRKTSGKGAVRAEREFSIFTSNEDMFHIMKIIKSLKAEANLEMLQHPWRSSL